MTFADPSACPDCASVLDGGSSCPHCRLDLTTDAARQLWAALRSADAWLEEARRQEPDLAILSLARLCTLGQVNRPQDALAGLRQLLEERPDDAMVAAWYLRLLVVIRRYAEAAALAQDFKLGINAGHDLNLRNLGPFLAGVPGVDEVSIGHALIARALFEGLAKVVGEYLAITNAR